MKFCTQNEMQPAEETLECFVYYVATPSQPSFPRRSPTSKMEEEVLAKTTLKKESSIFIEEKRTRKKPVKGNLESRIESEHPAKGIAVPPGETLTLAEFFRRAIGAANIAEWALLAHVGNCWQDCHTSTTRWPIDARKGFTMSNE